MDSVYCSPWILVEKSTVRLRLFEYRTRLMILVQFVLSLSLFLSAFGVVLTTSQFRDLAAIPGLAWEVAYVLVTVASAVWMIVSGWRLHSCYRELDPESVMRAICTQEPPGPYSKPILQVTPNFDVTPIKRE